MTIEKNHEGAWVVSGIVRDYAGIKYCARRSYYFYSKRQAIKRWREEFREVEA